MFVMISRDTSADTCAEGSSPMHCGRYPRAMSELRDALVARIRARGAITFADYMQAALYDPEYGYYSTRARIGFDGDYLTASDLGPVFGRLLARAAAEVWQSLGKPASWDLVGAGAGGGTALRDLVGALKFANATATRAAKPALIPIQGVVYANEVLDAFPVHVLVRTADGVKEAHVDEQDGRLVEVLRNPSTQDLRWRMPDSLPPGSRWEVSPAAEGWVAALGSALASGYLLFIDYGDEESGLLGREGAGTVRGFARHRLLEDPFADPGAHDLTATVNFTAIRRAAEGAGLRFAGAGTQRDVLVALGAREATVRSGTPIEQLRAASRRAATDALLDPNGFGAFRVVCYAKEAPAEGLRMFGTKPA